MTDVFYRHIHGTPHVYHFHCKLPAVHTLSACAIAYASLVVCTWSQCKCRCRCRRSAHMRFCLCVLTCLLYYIAVQQSNNLRLPTVAQDWAACLSITYQQWVIYIYIVPKANTEIKTAFEWLYDARTSRCVHHCVNRTSLCVRLCW